MRDLNSLIVQAKEAAADTKVHLDSGGEALAIYAPVWACAAGRTEKLSQDLEQILERISNPDEITARFLMMRAMENAVFEADITAFQAGLMMARAKPEHRTAFQPLCAKYDKPARNAQFKFGNIAQFLQELSGLIFQDMRENARQRIQAAVIAGRAAADNLSAPALPYGYLSDEIKAIAKTLDTLPLEEITVCSLEDTLLRLGTVRFAIDMDLLRTPQHRRLFDGVSDLADRLGDALKFFRSFSDNGAWKEEFSPEQNRYSGIAVQEGAALFYLKGEIKKLGNAHLDAEQKGALDALSSKLDQAIRMLRGFIDEGKKGLAMELLRETYLGLTAEAQRLGPYGTVIQYLAEEVKRPLDDLAEHGV